MRKILKKFSLVVGWLCLTLLGGFLGVAIAWITVSGGGYGDGIWLAIGGFFGLFVGALGGMVILVWVEDRFTRQRTAP